MLIGQAMTTAMGILPHINLKDAQKLTLSLDIPFWPQLPHFRFREDMYAQFAEHFPGMIVDEAQKRITFSHQRFASEIDEYLEKSVSPEYFALDEESSAAFHGFLEEDLSAYPMIHGQTVGPISFGLKICDEERKPMIYNDFVREILYDFLQRKIMWQYNQLKQVHPNPFVWLDEPGLEMIFNSLSAYTYEMASAEYRSFFSKIPGPKGVHLCGNPDWAFLLNANLDILSVDAFSWGHILVRYIDEVKEFLHGGGIISWGIVPTLTGELNSETAETLRNRLLTLWKFLNQHGLDDDLIYERSWLAPSRCCLINADGTASIEHSFTLLREISESLKTY
ncbi:hypothetical protein Desaci_2669 [Desulfosporosinus acidiphilus SJ4]|uniref:Methionine synthase II (Cobalamin-independent) n=1 Tax=Desulfosporosinus acidiphilus (strain DSM 22704 / JCM 16185 / SJ4) TaxID=646529 RepID=I4D727_DESAJ|nr:hypothetical protein [Desulfosporosinus acidiphilus]AFM41601.1 hypothetical protein Desaci_2669 [Desulfosporosinus acidiphilus SJ4]